MFRNDFKVMVTKALGATGLLLATACAGETGVEQGAQGLVAPGDVNRAYVQTAPMLDAAVGMVLIFCNTHMEMPTRTGSTGEGLRTARSSHRKWLLRGISWSIFTKGNHVYR